MSYVIIYLVLWLATTLTYVSRIMPPAKDRLIIYALANNKYNLRAMLGHWWSWQIPMVVIHLFVWWMVIIPTLFMPEFSIDSLVNGYKSAAEEE